MRLRSRSWALRPAASVALLALSGCHAPRATLAPDTQPTAQPGPPRDASVPPPLAAPTLHPVLADPRLARARVLVADHDWPAAATAMADAMTALSPDLRSEDEKAAWAYEQGRVLSSAGDAKGAALAFDRAGGALADAAAPPALAPYATFRAAEAYLKAGDFVTAADRARRVDTGSVMHDDAELVLASALQGQGHGPDAIPLWRGALAKNPRVWIDVALPLASALLYDVAVRPGESPLDRAKEALRLATRVVVEAPKIADSSGADGIRHRAFERIHPADGSASLELTLAERAVEARAWLDAGEPKRAATVAAAALKDPRLAKDPAAACSLSIVHAQALGRSKTPADAAWDDAIVRCEHDAALVTALYASARAVAGKHPDVARARYAKVEELFHGHRLADDARLQGALLALSAGDEAAFTRMMLSLPDDYPSGDQRTEALFRVAMLYMTRGDWASAAGPLDRIVALAPDDRHWATAGRAEYFRARAAAELGQKDDALTRYARVIDRHPFAYYMAQAYGRLAAADASLATRTLASAFAREDAAPFLASRHVELEDPAFARACRLLEVGDIELAKKELGRAGALADSVDPEVTWTLALLYDRAGAPEVGHALARSKLHDYLGHYPVGAWRTKWEIAYPRAFDDLVAVDSAASGIPSALTWAIMREESDFVADAKSPSNAYGLMQLIVPTARGVAIGTGLPSDEAGLREPKVNVALGTRLLGQLRATFAGNPALAIAAYNGGGGAVGRWIKTRGEEDFDLWVEEIPWEETRGYEKRVLGSEAAYAYLYDPAALDEVLRTSRTARGDAGRKPIPRADDPSRGVP